MVELSGFARAKRRRLLGCSVAALTMGMGGAAFADCLPNPPTTGGTVTCSGATTGGLTISSYATVNVASGASLTAGAGDEAAFTTTSTSGAFYGATVYLNVDGAIDGASASGVLVSSGPTAAYPATQLYIKVGQGGTIDGATAVQVVGTPGNTYGRAAASLDNSGVVQSTSGPRGGQPVADGLHHGEQPGWRLYRRHQRRRREPHQRRHDRWRRLQRLCLRVDQQLRILPVLDHQQRRDAVERRRGHAQSSDGRDDHQRRPDPAVRAPTPMSPI
ncbi:MAG TPA: hypothetical protein VNZ85_06640 [Caulobacter sp.]|nr:hypothetical protein [Caulobacter sp.]